MKINKLKSESFKKRGENRSRHNYPSSFIKSMQKDWDEVNQNESSMYFTVHNSYAAQRRSNLSKMFIGDRLIIMAGEYKVRSNDDFYRFRPHTAFAYLTGLGMDLDPGAILVFEPIKIKHKSSKNRFKTHAVTLYIQEMKGRNSDEFFTSSHYGEFWVGKRPSIEDFANATGINTKSLSEFEKNTKKMLLPPNKIRVIGLNDSESDEKLLEACSEMRLIKDKYEISQMREAIRVTKLGFERAIKNLPKAIKSERGERVVAGEFYANAIEFGNGLGYGTISAAGENATTLHWQRNNSKTKEGDLLLLDAGVELDSLYTADITRTIPINGKYTQEQKTIYEIVLKAADAAFKVAKPGNKFRDIHNEAMKVIVEELHKLGILRVEPEVSLSKNGQQHRRWMCHGTSHHLGMDVHDCAYAREHMYLDGVLQEGMIFTIEPGLYFKSDDLLIPEKYRGIGVRIEDNILITKSKAENLSKDIPRNIEHIESWIKVLQKSK